MRVAFVGLGVMGYPMAGYLAKAGHDVTVYNRTKEKAASWAAEYSGVVADTPAAAATNSEIVFCCVGDDPDVRAGICEITGHGITHDAQTDECDTHISTPMMRSE